jgi:hypothetical protein
MEGTLHQNQKDHKTVESRANPPLIGLKKYVYVLPSGRILKVVVDDEREIAPSTAYAC